MKAVLVVPDLELLKQPPRVTLTRHDHVVEQFAAHSADEALGVAVHLWGANSSLDGTDAEIPDPARELVSIRPIAISDQEPGCRLPGKRVNRLLAEPESGWVRRHVREDQAPAFERHNDEDIKNLESDRGHGEQVDGDDALGLIAQEGAPVLRTGPSRVGSDPFEVSRDRPFAYVEAELKKLAVDSGRTPGRVVGCHRPNKPSDLGLRSRSPDLRFPSPEESKRLAMPRDDGLGPDDDQTLSPRGKAVKDEGPEGSVPRNKGKTGGPRPKEDAELMPQGEVLGRHPSPRAEQGDERPQKESNQAEHAERIRGENESEEVGPWGAGTSIG